MSRGYPADTKKQNFFAEQYEKEAYTRLQWYMQKRRGKTNLYDDEADMKANVSSGLRQSKLNSYKTDPRTGLPSINPREFAKQLKREDNEKRMKSMEHTSASSSSVNLVEMRPPSCRTKNTLYHGFSKEGRGRYQYLKTRNEVSPEKKFEFPITSSWEYGWRIAEVARLKKPEYARTRKIKDTFYTRNGVPTLGEPARLDTSFERGITMA